MSIHTHAAAGKWQEMSFAEQMGNIGSEVSRARNADAHGQTERRNKSIARALELIDLTLSSESRPSRKRELKLFRDAMERAREGSAGASLEMIEQYCLPFALAARKHV